MKKINFAIFTALLLFYTSANAWFIFFIPGSITRGVTDAITGAKGNICVQETANVGDVVPSAAGNTMKILSLSGTSTSCRNPALPIRADVEFTFTFKSTAGVNLPDEFEAKSLTDLQRYNGTLLVATSKNTRNKGLVITSREKKANSDPQMIASAIETSQISLLAEGASKNAERLTLNGSNAWRFEVHGKIKGIFGTDMVYTITLLEGDNEILVVNAYSTQSDYEREKEGFHKIVLGIRGITTIATPENNPTINPQQQVGDAIQNGSAPIVDSMNTPTLTGSKLRELSKMLSEGLITQQEYEVKKAELLKGL